jgi:hypothetical protein
MRGHGAAVKAGLHELISILLRSSRHPFPSGAAQTDLTVNDVTSAEPSSSRYDASTEVSRQAVS